jgi:hypothetical protein
MRLYELDGDGICHLLRSFGDQLDGNNGVVSGQNPEEQSCIINTNHSDVPRNHALMALMQDQVFIEDIGSTDGTSLNVKAITDKAPVTLNNRDQIIISSAIITLLVLDH